MFSVKWSSRAEQPVPQNLFSSPEKIKLEECAVQGYLSEYLIHNFEQFIMWTQYRREDLLGKISSNIFMPELQDLN